MADVIATIGTDHYRTEVRTATNLLISDEPVKAGGEDLGFSPEELLAASLSACTAATLRMYADRKGWTELTGVKVHTTFAREPEKSEIIREVTLEGPLSNEQKERLMVIADKCPMHQVLTHPIHISTSLV
jgi:putative redox protein